MRKYNGQSGMVSILTVLFLMVLLSVFTISFIKIVSDEQRQATDNDLAASALAAAQSGIEDGKRIIMYCASHPGPACTNLLSSGNGSGSCDIFRSSSADMTALRSDLGISLQADGDVLVGSDQYKQSYTCLTISGMTDSLKFEDIKEQTSLIKSLSASEPITSLSFRWAPAQGDANYKLNNGADIRLPQQDNWKHDDNGTLKPKPPALRVQFIAYEPGNINLDVAETDSKAMFILPSTSGTPSVDIGSIDQRSGSGNLRSSPVAPVGFASCVTNGAIGYRCDQTFTGLLTNRAYYMRVTPLYGDVGQLTVTAFNSSGNPVKFSSQPTIDVTGRASDVFKRIRAQVSTINQTFTAPQYVLESANTICKNIVVTTDVNSSNYGCNEPPENPEGYDGNPGIGGTPGGNNPIPCWKRQPSDPVKKTGWFNPECWKVRITNFSTYSGDGLKGCYVDWDDNKWDAGSPGSPLPGTDRRCKNGAVIQHEYDPTPRVGDFRNYTIRLCILLKDGSPAKCATLHARRPR